MCATHDRMIPPVIQKALSDCAIKLRQNTDGPPDEVAAWRRSFRQARAYAFAAVCDQLGIDAEALLTSKDAAAEVQSTPIETQGAPVLRTAIKRELH